MLEYLEKQSISGCTWDYQCAYVLSWELIKHAIGNYIRRFVKVPTMPKNVTLRKQKFWLNVNIVSLLQHSNNRPWNVSCGSNLS